MMTNVALKSIDIPLADVSRITCTDQARITQLLATGVLGPPPASTSVAKLPLFHIAGILALQDAEELQVAGDRLTKLLPSISGAAYIRMARNALRKGHWVAGRGSANVIHSLSGVLQSDEGVALLEQQLPCGPTLTKKFSGFSKTCSFTFDNWDEVGDVDWPLRVINSSAIAHRLNLRLPGKLFFLEAQ